MHISKARLFASFALGFFLAAGTPALAQSAPDPGRQSLDDAWWTGPILANSAHTLPQGHALIETYLYDDIQGGNDAYRSFNYLLYGLTDRWTIGLIPVGGVNSGGGKGARLGLNDVNLQLQYGLTTFDAASGMPEISLAVREGFPTGKYDRLANANDGFGGGAYATTLALFTQDYFWLPNGRLLRFRLDLYESFSGSATLTDTSVYGTAAGFRGHARPGDAFLLDASLEYSLTRSWVLALEFLANHGDATHVGGADGAMPVHFDIGSSDGFGLAPAVEYSWAPNWGVLAGARILMAGRNTPFSVTPAIAINYVD